VMKNNLGAYITRSNFDRILRSLDQKSFENPEYSLLFEKDISFILTTKEMDILYSAMKAYEDLSFISENYRKISNIDTGSYAFEGGFPAYHYDPGCERIKSDFVNLEIPVEIKKLSKVEEYRDFCKNNRDLIKNNLPVFYKKLEAKFFLKNPPSRINYDNSGRAEIENMNLEELKDKANEIIESAHEFKNQSEENIKIINNKGYGTHKIPEAKVKGSVLYIWHNKYKQELKKILKQYYRVRLNASLKFEGDLLEQLGFIPCSMCKPN
jgi:hypothetical protein